MKILAIGGSGWLGSAFTRRALAGGHDVTVVSRGTRPIPEGARHLRVDRNDEEAFGSIVMRGHRFLDGGEGAQHAPDIDFVVDFMGRGMKHGVQLLGIDGWGKPNVFVSSDLVYSPRQVAYPLGEIASRYQTRHHGGRLYEMEWLFTSGSSQRHTVVLRPGYVYGPGRSPGPLPPYLDDPGLIETLRRGEPLSLPCGGRYLLQPLFLDDLVDLILAIPGSGIRGRKLNVAGPRAMEAREFYAVLARELGCGLTVRDSASDRLLSEHPEWEQYCRNRLLDLSALTESGLPLPRTTVERGIQALLAGVRA